MVKIKTTEEIEIMAEGGARLARILNALAKEVRPGMETRVFDKMTRELIKKEGARTAFLNYRPNPADKPFPAAICVSVNEVVVHGCPGDYVIKEGDLVKLDLGIVYRGYFSDSAVTVPAGKTDARSEKLMEATKAALHKAIALARKGSTLGDLGFVIQNEAKKNGFSVAHSLTGHGIGQDLHEDPTVFNTGRKGQGEELRPGMVLAIEPMFIIGKGEVEELPDGSFVSVDGTRSAHFEHTVAITEKGPKILTK